MDPQAGSGKRALTPLWAPQLEVLGWQTRSVEPVLTPSEMAAVDAAAADRMSELVQGAGAAVARSALVMMGGGYGRRAHVVAGPGNNGADGRVAAELLRRRGVRVSVGAHDSPVPTHVALDLVIDAAFGTGLSRPYQPPDLPTDVPVLAVDIPSGLDGRTGEFCGDPWTATATVTFAALKSGLVLGNGPDLCGEIEVADISLSVEAEVGSGDDLTRGLITDNDVGRHWPNRHADAHKWKSAVWVIGGAPGMTGAAALTAEAAGRSGAGYVLVSAPPFGGDSDGHDGGATDAGDGGARPNQAHLPSAPLPVEAVVRTLRNSEGDGSSDGGRADLGGASWPHVVADEQRVGALVIGNGLGRDQRVIDGVVELLGLTAAPVVLDADALSAGRSELLDACAAREGATVLTPHDGEYEALMGEPPGGDRLAAALALSQRAGSTVLLKGPTTVVASPDGRVRLVASGDQRLATAGTGDVLAGMIGAVLACDAADPLHVVAVAAHTHGRAALQGSRVGFRASDLPDLVAATLDELTP